MTLHTQQHSGRGVNGISRWHCAGAAEFWSVCGTRRKAESRDAIHPGHAGSSKMAPPGFHAPQNRNRGWAPGGKGKGPFANKRTRGGAARGRGGRRGWTGQQQQGFAGSTREGQGFALWRKQKVQLDYKKLLRKQSKKAIKPKDDLYAERYPEHLKHLYLAEAERLKNEEKSRKRKAEEEEPSGSENEELSGTDEEESSGSEEEKPSGSEEESSGSEEEEGSESEEEEPSGLKEEETSRSEKEEPSQSKDEPSRAYKNQEETVIKKAFKKKTALQKAKEEYEQVQHERQKKRDQAEEKRRKIEEARVVYKKKKMEAYKALCSKTKKGQPNFNVQMDYLLKKIQSKT